MQKLVPIKFPICSGVGNKTCEGYGGMECKVQIYGTPTTNQPMEMRSVYIFCETCRKRVEQAREFEFLTAHPK